MRPEDMGLLPDGDAAPDGRAGARSSGDELILDHAWANTEWTVMRALATVRFWAMFFAMFGGLFCWYALQAHQTKFLIDRGFDPVFAATMLGLVAVFGIFGGIGIGALSDRIGRELAWTLSMAGFGVTAVLFVLIIKSPSVDLVYLAVAAQGLFGYGMSAVFGAVISEVFAGRRVASILAFMALGGNLGGGAGPWVLGVSYDLYGSYETGFWICWGISILSIVCIWIVSPGRIRMVAGEARQRRVRRA